MVVVGSSRDRNSRGSLGPAAAAAAGGGGGRVVRSTGQAQREREGPGREHRERNSRRRLAQREGSLGPEQLPPLGPGRSAFGAGGQFPGGNSRGMVCKPGREPRGEHGCPADARAGEGCIQGTVVQQRLRGERG